MATYNGEKYIGEQLKSILSQTLLPNEIVICDDLSTDNTINIINDFKIKSNIKIRYFQNEKRLGFGQNFSRAIGLSKGDLIFLSDQDDFWFNDKLSYSVNQMQLNNKSYLFYNNAEFCDANLKPTKILKMDLLKRQGDHFIQGCCLMLKREIVPLILPIPKYISHDSWIGYIGRALDVIHFSSASKQYYRIHQSNTSTNESNQIRKIYYWNKLKV